jgi:hypothetical protein
MQKINRMRSQAQRTASRKSQHSLAQAADAGERSLSPLTDDRTVQTDEQASGEQQLGDYEDAEQTEVEQLVKQSRSPSEGNPWPLPPGITENARSDFEIAVRYLLETDIGEDEDEEAEARFWTLFAQSVRVSPAISASLLTDSSGSSLRECFVLGGIHNRAPQYTP